MTNQSTSLYPLLYKSDLNHLHPDYIVSLCNVITLKEPHTYAQASKDPRWIDAMNKEIAALEANDTWDINELPPSKKAISSKWVYKIKFKPDGTIERFKASFVVWGFDQIPDEDYTHTFSHVAKSPIVRTLIALATVNNWPIHQVDINNSFLHDFFNEQVYILPLTGYTKADGKACKLKRSLYGLKQASRQWNKELTTFLINQGFTQSKQDYSLFTWGPGTTFWLSWYMMMVF